jgi:DNA-directed RNA polymerase specialized sigma24 family protein
MVNGVPSNAEAFTVFWGEVEPSLRRAFVAAFGVERGREATQEALAWAWEHWELVVTMANPAGYLWRVGRSRSRPRRKTPVLLPEPPLGDPLIEPALVPALRALSPHQRAAVVLVHGHDWQLQEVAELFGVTVSTVQSHVSRAMAKLRAALEVERDAHA